MARHKTDRTATLRRLLRARIFFTMCMTLFGSQLLVASGSHRPAKDELVVLIETPPRTSDPRFAVDAYDFKFSKLQFAALVTVEDETLLPKFDLAESFTRSGCCEATIRLREARFSDGSPVTASDVVQTIAVMRDPRTGSRLKQRFLNMGLLEINIIDPKTLTIRLSGPRATLLFDFDFGILKNGNQLVGAGPYVITEQQGESYHFVKNIYYYGPAPATPKLTIRAIRDDNSRLLALVGGSADLTQNTGSQLLLDAVAENPQLRLETGRSAVLTYLGLNCEDPILKDPRVREAIALAIDRPQIIKQKLRGRAVIATSFLPAFHWAHDSTQTARSFDLRRSKRLLDEAGYPDPDGDGPQPRMTLTYRTSSVRWRVALATVIAHMLGEAGIAVDLRVNEFATFFADVKKGNFQIFSMQIPEIVEPDLYDNFFASNRIPTRENPDAGGNRYRYRNPELDRLLEEGRTTLEQSERKRIYAAVQQILARDLPMIPLWHEDNFAIVRREVIGYHPIPTAQFSPLTRAHKD